MSVVDCRPFFERLRARNRRSAEPASPPPPCRTYIVALIEDMSLGELAHELNATRLRLRNHGTTGELILYRPTHKEP